MKQKPQSKQEKPTALNKKKWIRTVRRGCSGATHLNVRLRIIIRISVTRGCYSRAKYDRVDLGGGRGMTVDGVGGVVAGRFDRHFIRKIIRRVC